jgi:hypothetical protein
MRNATNRREGMALLLALVLIVIISSIIAGTFVAATQEFRVGRNGLVQERALTAAEYGLNRVLAQWNRGAMPAKNAGDTLKFVDAVGNGATAVTTVTKLNTNTYLVVSEGIAGSVAQASARRRVGTLLRLNIPYLKMPGTLTTASPTNLSGNGAINNTDQNPTGWGDDCPPPGAPTAGVANDSAGAVTSSGTCPSLSCVTNDPKSTTTAAAADTMFGGLPYDSLTARATKTFTGGGSISIIQPSLNADGSCNLNDLKNWGDINRNLLIPGKCESYFPTIWFKGIGSSVTMSNGSGQGVMLVDGDLNISGNFTWVGAIIVRGVIKTTGVGVKFVGGVMSLNQNCTPSKFVSCNSIGGTASMQFSRCAIATAFAAQAYPALIKQRPWADMY